MTPSAWLLACDLDGTVIPPMWDDRRCEELAAFAAALERAEGVVLAYVTGRHFELALDGIQRHGLPTPDALACDVGTTCYRRVGEGFVLDEDYAARMQEALGSLGRAQVVEALQAVPGIELQPPEVQSDFKVSYSFAPDDPALVVAAVEARLREVQAHAKVIFSIDATGRYGLLDLLPSGVSKETAVQHLHRLLAIPRSHVLYAGDSGNDLEALLGGFNAVLVGNAAPVLADELRSAAARSGLEDHVYFAEGHYARGVLEGGRYFGMLE